MLEIAQLHYFIAAARSGSFRRAAEKLNVQQSSVSRNVRHLEDRLGVSLFERSPMGIRLTNAGQRFLSDALPALEQLELAQKTAASAGRADTGIIRVGIQTSLAGGFLRQLLCRYTHDHPEVAIDIRDGAREKHLAAIQQRQIDVAFLTGANRVLRCEVVELWRERVYVALSKDHGLARRRKLNWRILRGEQFIVTRCTPGPEIHDYIIRRVADYSTFPEIEIKDVNRETLLNLVSLGQGITPVSAAWSYVKLPGLVLRPLSHDEDVIPFSAIWSAQNDNPALRRFISVAHVLAGRARYGTSDWSGELVKLTPGAASVKTPISAAHLSSAGAGRPGLSL